ncbi:DegT/DnrJ/EryC1/StrS family aminotransferase [Candidatus Pelagibacter sp.]|nr:DegT/DnrJ/EryC1/StrS family aminotransferase [Candidatus Pelagibacter sp.]
MNKIPISRPNLGKLEKSNSFDAINSSWISSSGSYVKKFENQFSKFNGTKFSISVSNGSVALILALKALKISRGDEVIVPDLTFVASINSIIHAGATPVIANVNLSNWTLDEKDIEKKISSKTKAIIIVHLYGSVANIKKIQKIAKKKKIKIIEDSAEAHGAKYRDKNVGNFSDISCFSFFANKIFSTGEGGICATNNKKLYDRLMLLRNQGLSQKIKYFPIDVGFNFRMTNIQAAIGCAQISRHKEILRDRERIKKNYDKFLFQIKDKIILQKPFQNSHDVNWIYTIIIKNIDIIKLQKYLDIKKIETRPIFFPLSKNKIFKKYYKKQIKPSQNSSFIHKFGISLPTFFGLKKKQIKYICDQIINFTK